MRIKVDAINLPQGTDTSASKSRSAEKTSAFGDILNSQVSDNFEKSLVKHIFSIFSEQAETVNLMQDTGSFSSSGLFADIGSAKDTADRVKALTFDVLDGSQETFACAKNALDKGFESFEKGSRYVPDQCYEAYERAKRMLEERGA